MRLRKRMMKLADRKGKPNDPWNINPMEDGLDVDNFKSQLKESIDEVSNYSKDAIFEDGKIGELIKLYCDGYLFSSEGVIEKTTVSAVDYNNDWEHIYGVKLKVSDDFYKEISNEDELMNKSSIVIDTYFEDEGGNTMDCDIQLEISWKKVKDGYEFDIKVN